MENLEGKKIDNLEGTSPSDESSVELNNSTVPTDEEIKEMQNLSVDNESVPETELEQSDTTTSIENVDTSANETDIPSAEKLFTQSQVNDLVGKTRMETREQTYRAVYGRYGVDDEAGMDELVGNAQRYDTVRNEFDDARKNWETTSASRDKELTEVKEHVALLESGIDRNRFDDAKAIIRAKGLEITVDNINNELATHPEWKGENKVEDVNPNFKPSTDIKPQSITPEPESTIKVLGNEGNTETDGISEEEFALKNIFKL